MFVTSLIASLVLIQAPSDVPKEHWAFPAVDVLFREGLLKGYPASQKLLIKLDKSVKPDLDMAQGWRLDWEKKELISWFRPCRYSGPTKYELAVIAHTVLIAAQDEIHKTNPNRRKVANYHQEFSKLGKLISMFHEEITELGGDPQEMIKLLNNLADFPNPLFLGDKR